MKRNCGRKQHHIKSSGPAQRLRAIVAITLIVLAINSGLNSLTLGYWMTKRGPAECAANRPFSDLIIARVPYQQGGVGV